MAMSEAVWRYNLGDTRTDYYADFWLSESALEIISRHAMDSPEGASGDC